MRWREKGNALASMLMVISIAMLAALAMASRCLYSWQLGSQVLHQTVCGYMAQSVVEEAIAHVFADPTFGTHQETLLNRYPEGGVAQLTFVSGSSSAMPDAWSLNNLVSPVAVNGPSAQQMVPGYCVYLVGQASYAGCTRTVQCLLQTASAQLAVGSSGPVTSSGGLFVARLPPGLSLGPNPVLSQMLPATLASNSGANPAVALGPNTFISGNCEAVGSILLSPAGVQILGATDPGDRPVGLPSVPVTSFDPGTGNGVIEVQQGTMPGGTLSGVWRADSNLEVTQAMTLNNAVLYVNGAATFDAMVSGSGAVIVNGQTQLLGGASLNATQQMALVSAGDLTVIGQGKTVSSFDGLMYTGGNFTARNISMTGTFIANSPSGSRTEIDDSTVILQPTLNKVSFILSSPTPTAPSGGSQSGGSSNTGGPLVVPCGNSQSGTTTITLANGDTFTGIVKVYASGHYSIEGDGGGNTPFIIKDSSGNLIYTATQQNDPNGNSPNVPAGSNMDPLLIYYVLQAYSNASTYSPQNTNGPNPMATFSPPLVAYPSASPSPSSTPSGGATAPSIPQPTPSANPGGTPFTIDLSRFVLPEDNTRILFWRQP